MCFFTYIEEVTTAGEEDATVEVNKENEGYHGTKQLRVEQKVKHTQQSPRIDEFEMPNNHKEKSDATNTEKSNKEKSEAESVDQKKEHRTEKKHHHHHHHHHHRHHNSEAETRGEVGDSYDEVEDDLNTCTTRDCLPQVPLEPAHTKYTVCHRSGLDLFFFNIFSSRKISDAFTIFNPLSVNPTKLSNTVKQFICNLLTDCLSVFDQFVGLALIGLTW